MLTKERVIQTISKLPDQFTIDDVVEKLILIKKIEKGMVDSENDNVYTEEEVEKEMKEWLK